MTYFGELAEAVSRDPDVHSGELVLQGNRVPVDAIVGGLAASESVEGRTVEP